MAYRSVWRTQGHLTGYRNVWRAFAFEQSFVRRSQALLPLLCSAWLRATRPEPHTVWLRGLPLVRSPQGSRSRSYDDRDWLGSDDHASVRPTIDCKIWL